jgi:protein tyrosine phosphatase
VERVSVFGAVRRVREQRWTLVKNIEQYRYVYGFTAEWVKRNAHRIR